MDHIAVFKDKDKNTTEIHNSFIDEFMIQASESDIKVYLYLLYVLSSGIYTSLSSIASKFSLEQKEVLSSIRYWESMGLFCVDYDISGNPLSVRLVDPRFVKRVDSPPASLASTSSEPELKRFTEDKLAKNLIFIAEQYTKRPVTAKEINVLFYLYDELKLSEELIDYLIEYCVDIGKNDFRYMQKVGINWAKNGISTPAEAKAFSLARESYVYDIMKALGRSGTPSTAELEYINRWKNEYGYDINVIIEACDRTSIATDSHRFAYCEKILSSWKSKGVSNLEDVRVQDELYLEKKSNSEAKPNNKSEKKSDVKPAYQDFIHNGIKYSELEKLLVSNT